jgi:hypothetical protein
LYFSVARNTISNISQADNQLHSIIQGYMTYIEACLLLKIMTDCNLLLPPPSKRHLKFTNMGNLHEGAAYSRIRPIPLKISQCNQWGFQK